MINFVICEDEPLLLNKYINEIDKFMMRYDTDYKCYKYKGYDEEWKKYAQKEDGFKVYLLDIKTETGSGIDAARMIREEFDDWVSMIIIITAYNEYKYEALEKRLMLVDFINKLSNFESRLQNALSICMKNYDNRHKYIRYTYKNNIYNIDLKQIIFIEKEQDSKRCVIKTISNTYIMPGTLNSIAKNLDDRFIKCYRNMIINLEQVESYNTKEGKITFKNGESITAVSRNQKKEIVKYVRGLR
ncbi:MAG: LytTR family DNA-binding domain-containing protein [bacterium]|nr:LytTR family DNA-binding domain-containing protein [bacterium]